MQAEQPNTGDKVCTIKWFQQRHPGAELLLRLPLACAALDFGGKVRCPLQNTPCFFQGSTTEV